MKRSYLFLVQRCVKRSRTVALFKCAICYFKQGFSKFSFISRRVEGDGFGEREANEEAKLRTELKDRKYSWSISNVLNLKSKTPTKF